MKSRSDANVMERYLLKQTGKVLVEVAPLASVSVPVRIVTSVKEMDKVQPGDVKVTDMTDPDWEPS